MLDAKRGLGCCPPIAEDQAIPLKGCCMGASEHEPHEGGPLVGHKEAVEFVGEPLIVARSKSAVRNP